jgi:2-oxopent-4-enoate hydratase
MSIEPLADRLWHAQVNREPCAPLTEDNDLSVVAAYAIQQHNIDRHVAAGARIVGYKVGLTSHAIQDWLGVSQPDFGTLLDTMEVGDGGVVDLSQLLQPRAEGEVAFVLGRDLKGPGVGTAQVIAATRAVLPAIEIIASRIADWKITFEDTVADNASSGMFVLGSRPVPLEQLRLRTAGLALRKNGRVVSTGAGAACLDNPINAVAWLANQLAELGHYLPAGSVVLSGALGPVTELAPGDALQADIAGLGTVRFRCR